MPLYTPSLVTQRTAANSFAFVGDSRIAQMFNDGPYSLSGSNHVKTNHFFHVANALLGQRMRITYAGGISGDRSDQYLVNLPAAIASGAAWLMIWSVVNDITQYATTGDTALKIWTRIKSAAIQALNAGMNVIIVGEPGSTGFAAGTQIGMVYQFNEYAREFCAATPGAYYFDAPSVMVNPASSAIAFQTNYSTDGTHLNGYGGWYVGNAFASFINPLIPPLPTQLSSAGEIPSNGNLQQLTNPLFVTGTGGTFGAGMTGTLPLGFFGRCTGSTTATASVASDPSGFGNVVNLACSFAAAGDTVQLLQGATLSNFTIPGDIVESGCEILVASGATNLNGVELYTNFGNVPNPTADLWPLNAQALPGVAMDLVLRSVPFTLPTGTSWITWQVQAVASGAGSATITIKRPWLRRRFS